MKALITIAMLALALSARAGYLTSASAYYTLNIYTNCSGLNTNVTLGNTNYCEDVLYHTFYFNSTSNLNGETFRIDFSGDTTNWNTYGTVALSATAGAAQNNMTNVVAKESYFRVVTTGTNCTSKFNYLGGR